LTKSALLSVAMMVGCLGLASCGGSAATSTAAGPSRLSTRVLASQSVSSPTAFPGLVVINGEDDTLPRAAGVGAGNSPGLMAISSNRATLLAFDSVSNTVDVVNTQSQSLTGNIQLGGATTSMVALETGSGYVAVPAASFQSGPPPGAVEVMNLTAGGLTATLSVPGAQTVVASPDGTHLLVFSNDSDVITVIYPLLVNSGSPTTATVQGCAGCRPAYAVFSADSSTAYILNCGPECGGASATASVQTLSMTSLAPGPTVAVDGATIGLLSGSTLYVAGNSTTNNSCTGESTAATTCGRLDLVDLGSMAVTSSVVITDGYHWRVDMSINGQLFIGSHTCTNIGNVNNPEGEVRGCLSIYNTSNATVVVPPDNGDVTGLQSFTTRDVEYVAEGGNLRVYDTLIDSLLLDDYIETGTITITGYIIDVKSIDFF
jgi:hypothetical protein